MVILFVARSEILRDKPNIASLCLLVGKVFAILGLCVDTAVMYDRSIFRLDLFCLLLSIKYTSMAFSNLPSI